MVNIDRLKQCVNNYDLRAFSIVELEEALLLLNRNLAEGNFQQGQHARLLDSVKALLQLRTNAEPIRTANRNSRIAICVSVVAVVVPLLIHYIPVLQ